jgi:hypothetical protein
LKKSPFLQSIIRVSKGRCDFGRICAILSAGQLDYWMSFNAFHIFFNHFILWAGYFSVAEENLSQIKSALSYALTSNKVSLCLKKDSMLAFDARVLPERLEQRPSSQTICDVTPTGSVAWTTNKINSVPLEKFLTESSFILIPTIF